MQSHNQPLHTLLGQRQYWAPLLAPSLHREQSTCQDVDYYSQATPREDNNSAGLASMCYFMTCIHTLSVCKRSEQRQSVDWESWLPFVRGAVQLKSLFFFWITKVWLIEIAFPPSPHVGMVSSRYQQTIGEKCRFERLWQKSWSNVHVMQMWFLKIN